MCFLDYDRHGLLNIHRFRCFSNIRRSIKMKLIIIKFVI